MTPPARAGGRVGSFPLRPLPCLPDTLCNELDQERKARYAIQQKLKGAEAQEQRWGGGGRARRWLCGRMNKRSNE